MADIKDLVEPLSDKLQPPPLKEREKAVFRLLSLGKKEHGREEPTAPEVVQMAAQERITDPFTPGPDGKPKPKRKVMGTIITDYKIVNGAQIPRYKAPQFIRGYCVTTSEEPEMYTRLFRSLKCRNNKYRGLMGGSRVKPTFELVEESSKEVSEQLHLADLRWHAEGVVRNGSWMDLKAIATKLRTSPEESLHTKSFIPGQKENDLQGLKMELIHIATLYPKQLIAASSDKASNVKVQVFESMRFGILIFDEGAYHVMGKDNKLDEVFKPSPDQDPVDSLVQYFMSEVGKKDYVTLANLLKQVLAPRG